MSALVPSSLARNIVRGITRDVTGCFWGSAEVPANAILTRSGETYTADAEKAAEGVSPTLWRLNWTAYTATITYILEADERDYALHAVAS